VKALERFIAHVDANVDVVKLWETSAPSNASSSGGDFLNQDHSSNSGNANVMQGSWRRDLPESDLPPVMVGSFLNRMYRLMRDCPLWCPAMEPVADGTWNKTKVNGRRGGGIGKIRITQTKAIAAIAPSFGIL
jgi:hypothetical protein